MPRGSGGVSSGLLGQVVATASAGGGHEGDDLLQTFGGQASLEGGRMSGLTAWFFSGRRFDDGLGCLRRIGGGRQRGVGSVLFKLFFEDANTLGQRGQLLLQACDDLITLPTSKTREFVQTRILWMKRASSCPRGRNRLNGYCSMKNNTSKPCKASLKSARAVLSITKPTLSGCNTVCAPAEIERSCHATATATGAA